MKKKEEKDRP